ncbi:MAG: helix-turn-helix domain-containing protein [Acidobacteria bacterium]|nr:helix-turn-helix domain-containing protein [Acidobacteriota bacterium]
MKKPKLKTWKTSGGLLIEESSGNIFADLDLPNPEELLFKAKLASLAKMRIAERKLTQKEAGRLLGLAQPDVSSLIKGKLMRFSIERLFEILSRLGYSIEYRVMETKKATKSASAGVKQVATFKRVPERVA